MGQCGAKHCRTQSSSLCGDRRGSYGLVSLQGQNLGDRAPKVSCKQNVGNRTRQERGCLNTAGRTSWDFRGSLRSQTPGLLHGPQLTRHIYTPVHQGSACSAQWPPISGHTLGRNPSAFLSLSLHVTVCHLPGSVASGAHPRWASPLVPSPSVPLF